MIKAMMWRKFCGEDGRYLFGNPFIIDGWKYATDGRIMIRSASNKPNTETTGSLPNNGELFAEAWTHAGKMCAGEIPLALWPKPNPNRPRECEKCNEHGRDPSDQTICAFCDGTSLVYYQPVVEINGGKLRGEMVSKIGLLPDVQVAKDGTLIPYDANATKEIEVINVHQTIVFVFDNLKGQGIVAQTTEKKEAE